VAQIRSLADKMFYSSKATTHIYSHTKFGHSILITSWLTDCPKIQDGVVVV